MDTRPIGIIDSGSGGLSIWQSLQDACPFETIVYIGDHKYVPYGSKTTVFIVARVQKIIRILLKDYSCKLIIIACNSATVAGIDIYRNAFPGVPIIGVVPVVKTAAKLTKTGSIAILATPYTTKSVYQKQLIKQFTAGKKVYAVPCPKLVTYIEKGMTTGPVIRKVLNDVLKQICGSDVDTVALGCTHFPFIRKEISDLLGAGVTLLDSGGAVARQTMRIMDTMDIRSKVKNVPDRFLTTGRKQQSERVATKLLQIPVKFQHISIV